MPFIHNQEGFIIIGNYIATLSEFASDLNTLGLDPYPGLPEGATGRRYVGPGQNYIFDVSDPEGVMQQQVWTYGQMILSHAPAFAALMNQRLQLAPPSPTMLKTELYDRMTDDELALLEAFLNEGATIRQRMRFRDAVELDRRDTELQGLAALLFGAERAAVLLA